MKARRLLAAAITSAVVSNLAALAHAQDPQPAPDAVPADPNTPPPHDPPPSTLPPPNSASANPSPLPYEPLTPAPREPSLSDNVIAFYSGLQLGIAPGLAWSTRTGKLAFALGLGVGYGIATDSVVIIPSVHTNFIFGSGETIITGLPGAGVVFPLGPVGLRLEGGAGPGYSSAVSKAGFAWRAMAAISVHPSRRTAFGLGAEYTSLAIANLSLVGPVLILAF